MRKKGKRIGVNRRLDRRGSRGKNILVGEDFHARTVGEGSWSNEQDFKSSATGAEDKKKYAKGKEMLTKVGNLDMDILNGNIGDAAGKLNEGAGEESKRMEVAQRI